MAFLCRFKAYCYFITYCLLPFQALFKGSFKVRINKSNVVTLYIDNDTRYHGGQNTKNRPKYVRKMYFMRFHLFCLGDLTSRKGQREIRSVSGRVGIGAFVLVNTLESFSHQFKSIHNRLFLP